MKYWQLMILKALPQKKKEDKKIPRTISKK